MQNHPLFEVPENVTTKKGAAQKGNEDGFSFSSGLKRGGGFAEVGPTGRRIFLLQEIDWEDVRMAARGEQRGPTRFRRNISSEKGVQKFPSKDEGKEKKPNKRIRETGNVPHVDVSGLLLSQYNTLALVL